MIANLCASQDRIGHEHDGEANVRSCYHARRIGLQVQFVAHAAIVPGAAGRCVAELGDGTSGLGRDRKNQPSPRPLPSEWERVRRRDWDGTRSRNYESRSVSRDLNHELTQGTKKGKVAGFNLVLLVPFVVKNPIVHANPDPLASDWPFCLNMRPSVRSARVSVGNSRGDQTRLAG
jgi:hypothetical protein